MTKTEAKIRDEAGQCIRCQKQTEQRKLGLCPRCYQRYLRPKRGLTAPQKAEYDRLLTEAGLILPSRQGRRLKPGDDVYDNVADAIRESKSDYQIDQLLNSSQHQEP